MEKQFFLPLVKADEEKRLVWARAAVEEPDKAREIMDYRSAVPEFKLWSKQFSDATLGKSLGNVRAMHNPRHLAGKVQEIIYNDPGKSVDVCIKVLDPVDWHKLEEGGYTGISIGGGYRNKWPDPLLKGFMRYTPRIGEISFVDSPCMTGALILEMQKIDGSTAEVMLKGVPRTFADLLPPPTFGVLLHKGGFIPPMRGAVRIGVDSLLNDAEHLRGKKLSFRPSTGHAQRDSTFADAPARVGWGKTLRIAPNREGGYRTSSGKTFKQSPIADLLKSAAHPGFDRAAASIAHREGVSPEGARAILAAGARRAGKTAIRHNPRLRRVPGVGGRTRKQELIDKLRKDFLMDSDNSISTWQAGRQDQFQPSDPFRSPLTRPVLAAYSPNTWPSEGVVKQAPAPATPAAKAKIHTVLHEFKHGTLRSWRGTNPDTGKPRRGPKVEDRRQAIAIALNQARRMGKGADSAFVAALADRTMLAKRAALAAHAPDPRKSRGLRVTAARGKDTTATPQGRGDAAGDDKRIAAAKARWHKEGHPDVEAYHGDLLNHAKRAILGRDKKVAAVQQQIGEHWHSVADAQDAYDKMRQNMPKEHGLMMEVPYSGGLLHNPEGVGAKDFDAAGKPKKKIYLMHPHEVDDWIAKHGTKNTAVQKMQPFGAVNDIADLTEVAIAA